VELQEQLEELQAQGLAVAAISYDTEAVLTEFSEKNGITFPLLSDDDSKVITEYGILNTVANEAYELIGARRSDGDADNLDPVLAEDIEKYVTVTGGIDFHIGTAYPGTFIVDRRARVTSRFFEEFYRERTTIANIMLQRGTGLTPIAAVEGSTAHLKFTAYPSDPYVRPGSRISLAIEIEPEPNMHLYAPGAEERGYRTTAFNLRPAPHVQFEPVVYPESEIYHFEPLDELVPVYQSQFTLLQDVVISASAEAEQALSQLDALTLTGSLDYQACSDSFCYNPVSLPISFTLDLRGLDRSGPMQSSPLRARRAGANGDPN
jgi:hypothetical protein